MVDIKTGLTGSVARTNPPSSSPVANVGQNPASEVDQAEAALRALHGRAAWLAFLVYRDLAAFKVLLEKRGATEVEILDNGRSTTVAVGFVMDGRAWLVFRGSDDDDDWVLNLTCLPAWHIGFLLCYQGIAKKVRQWVDRVAPLKLPFCIVGHSLGGALATLATRRIARRGRQVEMLCTFGAPRVYGPGTALWFNSRSANQPDQKTRTLFHVTHRFVDRHELVCYTPPFFVLFKHVGRRIDCEDVSELLKEATPAAQTQGEGVLEDLQYAISKTPIAGSWFDGIKALGTAIAWVVKKGARAGKAHEMERYAGRVDYNGVQQLEPYQKKLVPECAGGRVRFTSKLIVATLMLLLVLAIYVLVPTLLIGGLWWLAVNVPWGAVVAILLTGLGTTLSIFWQRRSERPPKPFVDPHAHLFGPDAGKPLWQRSKRP